MSNYQSQIDKIPKWHQKKYFSHETGGGKGDTPREQTTETRDNYSKGYDSIDWSKK